MALDITRSIDWRRISIGSRGWSTRSSRPVQDVRAASGRGAWQAYAYDSVNGIAVAPETRAQLAQLTAPLGIRAPWD